jgi:hypothetical protein
MHGELVMWGGVMWCAELSAAPFASLSAATEYAGRLRVAGFTNWRLPTHDELESLLDPVERALPAFMRRPFPLVPPWHVPPPSSLLSVPEYVLHRVEEAKCQMSREELLSLCEEAVAGFHESMQITEQSFVDAVDRHVVVRLGLYSPSGIQRERSIAEQRVHSGSPVIFDEGLGRVPHDDDHYVMRLVNGCIFNGAGDGALVLAVRDVQAGVAG